MTAHSITVFKGITPALAFVFCLLFMKETYKPDLQQ